MNGVQDQISRNSVVKEELCVQLGCNIQISVLNTVQLDDAVQHANRLSVGNDRNGTSDALIIYIGKIAYTSGKIGTCLCLIGKRNLSLKIGRTNFGNKDIVRRQNTDTGDQTDGLEGLKQEAVISAVKIQLGSKVRHGRQIFTVRQHLQRQIVLDLLGLDMERFHSSIFRVCV